MNQQERNPSVLRRVLKNFADGLLATAVRRRLRPGPPPGQVRWHGTDSPQLAAQSLALRVRNLASDSGGKVLLLGDGGELEQQTRQQLHRHGIALLAMALEEALALDSAEELAAVICTYPDARRTAQAERRLRAHPALGSVPFEYAVGLEPERAVLDRLDEYRDARFVAPSMIDEIPVYGIYEESLSHFEQKCGLRDYLDLFQCLKSVVERGIAGDVAEFGSYKGHSGYLIARLLQHLDPARCLFMFDTFDAFPQESLGVDRFWSGTHTVSFEQVQQRLAEFPNVTLERGEFGQTLPHSALRDVALAYVDCDSYRGVRFVAEALWHRIPAGGCMIFEDYGHPALLGARSAVHEFFDGRGDAIRWYSHFSGLYIAFRTTAS